MQDNFIIFFENLSAYHIFFDVVSLLAFIGTIWYCWGSKGPVDSSITSEMTQDEDLVASHLNEFKNSSSESTEFVHANLKGNKQQTLLREISSKLTTNELEEEKKVEQQQLERIFELLRQQKDKFQMTSMEQVQEQMHLYGI